MTVNSTLIHPYQEIEDASEIWNALKEKFSTPSTTSKYLEFKVMYDTIISEDSHSQATFAKICRHLDLLQNYKCEVPATLQFLLILAKLPQYMDVFTQILDMSTSTKQMSFSVKGKETEKEKDPLFILANIERMALVAWQQRQSGKKKSRNHAHKISAIKHNPGDP